MISLRQKIAHSGPISLANYMAETTRHYYATRDPFGTAGDFTTAPEISQMFGEMIGLWCAQIWQQNERPKSALAELGPGRGTLMDDLLRAASVIEGFVEAQTIYLIEQSPQLKEMQKKKIPQALSLNQFSDLPSSFLLLVANEFFDALPIRQFERTEQGWRERCVGLEQDQFVLTLSQTAPDIQLDDAPIGTIAEICPQGERLITEIADHIHQNGGAALIIDYGSDQTIFCDSLQAVQHHQFCSVLKAGEADITAHVRFSRLAQIAEAHHMKVDVITQAEFLQSLGITTRAAKLAEKASPQDQQDIQMALKRLIDPEQMGSLFKVMTLR